MRDYSGPEITLEWRTASHIEASRQICVASRASAKLATELIELSRDAIARSRGCLGT
jgi:hypothetical protein